MKRLSQILYLLIITLASCSDGVIRGEDLSDAEYAYVADLCDFKEGEQIILFHSQAGSSDRKMAGNFYTSKRIGAYWIDDNPNKSAINFALFSNIDSIQPHDLSSDWTMASYLKVFPKKRNSFKVYVSGKKKEVWKFMNRAMVQWEINKKR